MIWKIKYGTENAGVGPFPWIKNPLTRLLRYRVWAGERERDSAIILLISNISKVSLPLSPFCEERRARMIVLRGVSCACCVAEARARLYIKWCSRFTSQIESRAIGRFSISFNNGLCYTSPTSPSRSFLLPRYRSGPSYFRSARSRISFQERIHRIRYTTSRCWGFVSTARYP